MKTATVTAQSAQSVWGNERGVEVAAIYRGKLVVSLLCDYTEEVDTKRKVRVNLKNRGFTHYRTNGVGPLKKL